LAGKPVVLTGPRASVSGMVESFAGAGSLVVLPGFKFMAIEEPGVVDAAGLERDAGVVVLTIADAEPWDAPEPPTRRLAIGEPNSAARLSHTFGRDEMASQDPT